MAQDQYTVDKLKHPDPVNIGLVGGSGSVLTSETDPTGVLEATGPAICLGTGASDGGVWTKTSEGQASDWVQLIAPPELPT